MRLTKFLLREQKFTTENIQKDCSTAWKLHEEGVDLLRGTWEIPYKEIVKLTPRTDRRPMSTTLWLHAAADSAFKAVFGKPLRSCSVFCTGSEEMASDYGNPTPVFPSNDFEVYWSRDVRDFTVYANHPLPSNSPEVNALFACGTAVDFNFKQFLKNPKVNEILKPYISSNNTCDYEEAFHDLLKKYPSALIDWVKAKYKKGNLTSATRSGNEIMLTCSFYYMIGV